MSPGAPDERYLETLIGLARQVRMRHGLGGWGVSLGGKGVSAMSMEPSR